MKRKILIFGILVVGLFLVNGQGCEDVPNIPGFDQSSEHEGSSVVTMQTSSTRTLVDRSRYVTGGNPPFDFTTVIFTQKAGKGFMVEANADREVRVEVMTDKDCLLKAQGEEYRVLFLKQGSEVKIVNEETLEEARNLCVGATALADGQIEIKFKVTELSY